MSLHIHCALHLPCSVTWEADFHCQRALLPLASAGFGHQQEATRDQGKGEEGGGHICSLALPCAVIMDWLCPSVQGHSTGPSGHPSPDTVPFLSLLLQVVDDLLLVPAVGHCTLLNGFLIPPSHLLTCPKLLSLSLLFSSST